MLFRSTKRDMVASSASLKVVATFSDAELATISRFVHAALDLQRDQLARLKAEGAGVPQD